MGLYPLKICRIHTNTGLCEGGVAHRRSSTLACSSGQRRDGGGGDSRAGGGGGGVRRGGGGAESPTLISRVSRWAELANNHFICFTFGLQDQFVVVRQVILSPDTGKALRQDGDCDPVAALRSQPPPVLT